MPHTEPPEWKGIVLPAPNLVAAVGAALRHAIPLDHETSAHEAHPIFDREDRRERR